MADLKRSDKVFMGLACAICEEDFDGREPERYFFDSADRVHAVCLEFLS